MMTKVSDLFDVYYGSNLELNALERDEHGINFVSRTEKNNGVSAKVKRLPNIEPIAGGTISVAGGGNSVMESCLQLQPYYSGRDVLYLVPKETMSNEVKLFYCVCLKVNRFKFSFGRQANATLKDLMIPSEQAIPQWVKTFSIKKYAADLLSKLKLETKSQLSPQTMSTNRLVPLRTLFTPISGIPASDLKRFAKKPDDSYVPLIRPSFRQSTSVDAYVSKKSVDSSFVFPKGTLYISTDGQGSHTFAYVSTFEFIPNSNVSVLIPNRDMNLQEKLYYARCITDNRFKFSYGRKPKGERLKSIMLLEHIPKTIADYDITQILTRFSSVVDRL
jgi:hypothetical protein